MEDVKKRILIVEDDAELANLFQVRLEQEGYEVEAAGDGEKALAAAVKVMPDLIVLDVMMPQISGFDVLDILKNTEKTQNIKIVLLTALSQVKNKEHAIELGAEDYLVKSETTLDEVVNCIRNNLD
ncbi:MAG: response regulator transcription factor [Candidatus Saccharimonadales bacterium]